VSRETTLTALGYDAAKEMEARKQEDKALGDKLLADFEKGDEDVE
jgi:hypothetical protein